MTAAERVIQQLRARRVRENEYRARCPVHQGKSDTSLSIKDDGDKVLIHCHAGCELKSILAALGMRSAADLFNSVRTKPDYEALRKARIERGLDIWCERRLSFVCELLRDIDFNIRHCAAALSRFETGELRRDHQVEEKWWGLLASAYQLRNDLDEEFEILNGRDRDAKYELFRKLKHWGTS